MTAITEKLSICTVTAFALVVALTPAVRTLTRRLNIVAPPCEESGHPEPTPVLGGVAIVVAVIASLIPALRATRLDPILALHEE